MKKNRSLAVVSEDSLITKIIKSLKNFLKVKQDNKEEVINRRAMVIQEEKIERRLKRSITNADLSQMDEKISKDISYINSLNEDELNSLDDYYDSRISDLEAILNDKKSRYFKLISSKRM